MGLLAFLVLSTQIRPTADVVAQAERYFSAEEIEQGQSFAFQRRWIFWANALGQLALLVYLVFTPLGQRVYLACGEKVQNHWFAHLALLGGAYFLASTAIAFPFDLARHYLSANWGMTSQSLGGWLGDYALGILVQAALDGAVVLGFYAIMLYFPKLWWLVGGAAGLVFGVIVAFILPDVIAPLFNTFTPIRRTEWKNVELRVGEMAQRVGASAADIYVVDASRQSHASNAYVTGLRSSQRIVLYDNLLKNHSLDEIDTVISHEMGHWHHWHILQGLLFGGVALTGGLYLLFRYVDRLVDGGVLLSAADPAGLFRILLIAQLAYAATLPIQNLASRIMERQADEVALDLSKKPRAVIEAQIRLAKLNKSNVAPSRWNVILFATHPPAVERIQRAEQWEKEPPKK